MPYKVITLPFNPDKEVFQEDILNQFCLNKKVVSCKSEFFKTSDKAYFKVGTTILTICGLPTATATTI